MLSRKLLNLATLLPLLLLNNSIYNNTIFQNHRLPTIPNPSHQTPFPIPSSEGGARALPSSLKPGTKQDEPSKELPKFSVKLFLHSSGHVAVKFQYDQVIISAFRRIPRASWNAKERLWMFPLSSLSKAEKALGEISNYKVQLEVVKDKIKSSKSKDESESLKFTQKNLINKIYTNSADAKIPAVLEYLGTVIEAGCKFLIFAHHQPMINAIHECLLKKKVGCFWIDGGTPGVHQGNNWLQISRKRIIYIKAAVLSVKAGELD